MGKATIETLEFASKTSIGAYVGDICYVLDDDVYDKVWGEQNNYDDGEIFFKEGGSFAVFTTGIGDGVYNDTCYRYSFPVDAGVIGMITGEMLLKYGKKELILEDGTLDVAQMRSFGAFFEVDKEVRVYFEAEYIDNGWGSTHYTVEIGTKDKFEIYTDESEDPDYEEDEEEDEEDE